MKNFKFHYLLNMIIEHLLPLGTCNWLLFKQVCLDAVYCFSLQSVPWILQEHPSCAEVCYNEPGKGNIWVHRHVQWQHGQDGLPCSSSCAVLLQHLPSHLWWSEGYLLLDPLCHRSGQTNSILWDVVVRQLSFHLVWALLMMAVLWDNSLCTRHCSDSTSIHRTPTSAWQGMQHLGSATRSQPFSTPPSSQPCKDPSPRWVPVTQPHPSTSLIQRKRSRERCREKTFPVILNKVHSLFCVWLCYNSVFMHYIAWNFIWGACVEEYEV